MTEGNIKHKTENRKGESPAHAAGDGNHFPLGLCLAGLIVSGLGLSACVLGVQWGPATGESEILDRAWLYVNLSVALLTLLVWPALRLRGTPHPADSPQPRETLAASLWELCTLAIAVIPALGVAAWLSATPGWSLARMIALQLGFATLGLGAVAWRKHPRWHAAIAGLLVLLTLILPLLAYLQAEFAPAASRAWFAATPLLTVVDVATNSTAPIAWWMAALWTAAGVILAGLTPRK
jgi:hypothetical protein